MGNENVEDTPAAPPLTNEQRLRALTGDRRRKSGAKGKTAQGDPGPQEADIVDAVRERSRDQGRDTPF